MLRFMQYVAYYRVSTDKQRQSGLGLDAQRQAVQSFIKKRDVLIAEHTEVESTKKKDRPALREALAACRKHKAHLLIARLDRLARNVLFIANLMESGVEFTAVDMPQANRLTIHIIAAVAEYEREMISKRTKDALSEAKKRGVKIGNPHPIAASKKGVAVIKASKQRFHDTARPLIKSLQQKGYTLYAIAEELNQRHVPTARGKQWHATTVRNILTSSTV